MIDKLSTDLKQTVPYYVNCLMTNVVIKDINCKHLVELEIILLLCKGNHFCVNSEIFFRNFTRFFSEGLEALHLIGLPSTRTEKLKDTYYMYVQTLSMILVHDFFHQKQNFLKLRVCHIDRPAV